MINLSKLYYTFAMSMSSPCILTYFGLILLPGGFLGSNWNDRPETCGNLPSCSGHCETPFSRPSWIWAPTVWYEIIFRHLNVYSLANMPDIDKIPFGYCLDINSWYVECLKKFRSQSGSEYSPKPNTFQCILLGSRKHLVVTFFNWL